MNEVFEFLNGKTYTLDGISGSFRHEVRKAAYPYPHTYERLIHEADTEGLRSEPYLAQKRELRDDWISDLTDNVERYVAIAYELGYTEDEGAKQPVELLHG